MDALVDQGELPAVAPPSPKAATILPTSVDRMNLQV